MNQIIWYIHKERDIKQISQEEVNIDLHLTIAAARENKESQPLVPNPQL
jgi:hypothetical protein